MPIFINCEQNTPEWEAAKVGVPSASEFDKILTPGGKPSEQAEAYAHRLLAEQIVGRMIDSYQSPAMADGNAREDESVAYYELQRSVTTERIGFCLTDDRAVGCSPDRLVGKEGLLETKNPLAHTHIGYLLGGKLDKKYWPQLQGQLFVTGRRWVDIVSYFPEIRPKIIRIERDEPYLALLSATLGRFCAMLADKREQLVKLGYLEIKKADPSRFLGAG
jgi:hypothetical protein